MARRGVLRLYAGLGSPRVAAKQVLLQNAQQAKESKRNQRFEFGRSKVWTHDHSDLLLSHQPLGHGADRLPRIFHPSHLLVGPVSAQQTSFNAQGRRSLPRHFIRLYFPASLLGHSTRACGPRDPVGAGRNICGDAAAMVLRGAGPVGRVHANIVGRLP